MITSENKKSRNYSHEHQLRKKYSKRLIADLDRDLVDTFKKHLSDRGLSYAGWLQQQIDREINGGR